MTRDVAYEEVQMRNRQLTDLCSRRKLRTVSRLVEVVIGQ